MDKLENFYGDIKENLKLNYIHEQVILEHDEIQILVDKQLKKAIKNLLNNGVVTIVSCYEEYIGYYNNKHLSEYLKSNGLRVEKWGKERTTAYKNEMLNEEFVSILENYKKELENE